MTTIALVDDENSIRTSVSIALESEGFKVDVFNNGVEALQALETKHYDLGLFDIKMPKMDGNELLSKVRSSKSETLKKMPVIFLTSKDQEQDRLKGLMQGVDDYVTKGGNFSKQILIETIKNTLNRIKLETDEQDSSEIIVHNDLRLDCLRQECEWRGKLLDDPLTTTEFKIIKELVQRPGVVKTRDRLMDIAYRDEMDVDDRTIDSHVKRIRKKFKKIDQDFQSIHTLYGSGYQWK